MDGVLRPGRASDVDECVRLWVRAVAARDGTAPGGTAERARRKFDQPRVAFVVADAGPAGEAVAGFALVTAPGTGSPSDPPDAAYLGMIAVAPERQGGGMGGALLAEATRVAAAAAHPSLVLHVLVSNTGAVRLYESRGWRAHGDATPHPLTGMPTQTFALRPQ